MSDVPLIKSTPEYLDKFVALGLTNDAFWRIHHYRLRGRRDTIRAHRQWTAAHPSRANSTNELVRQRLEFMDRVIEATGLQSISHDVWIALAEAAWLAIPRWGPHVRGRIRRGEIDKDYEVRT
jgi:hypothetical protein